MKEKKYLVFILFIFSFLLTGCEKNILEDQYAKTENILKEKAQEYKTRNGLNLLTDFYVNFNLLGVSIPEDCNNLSGAIIRNNSTIDPILECNSYKTKIVNNEYKYIKLIGNEVTYLNDSSEYVELGYESDYKVTVSGVVGSSKGVYTLYYNVMNNNMILETVKRIVIRTDAYVYSDLYPKITLNDESIMYINSKIGFEDPGVIALDSTDGDLTYKVNKKGIIDFNTDGEQEILYYVTNSKGYTTGIKRKVMVFGNSMNSDLTYTKVIYPDYPTKESKMIYLLVMGDYFKEAILPDGSITDQPDIQYEIKENGAYLFVIKDKAGMEYQEIVNIDDIDKEPPKATCNATIYDDQVYIVSQATDNSGIKEYSYNVNGVENRNVSTTFIYKKGESDKVSEVSIKVSDNAGNEVTTQCPKVDKTTKIYCELNRIYHGTKYSLTDSQIRRLACTAQREYGSDIIGTKAVASQMANLYEYKKWSSNSYANKHSLYDYVQGSGWYAAAKHSCSSISQNAINAIKDCIINGNRTLPLYVNEFDWYPKDVRESWGNEKNFVPFKTKIKNIYGGGGTFLCITANERKTDANIFFYNEGYKKYVEKTYDVITEPYHD